jgi:hypothetical protein
VISSLSFYDRERSPHRQQDEAPSDWFQSVVIRADCARFQNFFYDADVVLAGSPEKFSVPGSVDPIPPCFRRTPRRFYSGHTPYRRRKPTQANISSSSSVSTVYLISLSTAVMYLDHCLRFLTYPASCSTMYTLGLLSYDSKVSGQRRLSRGVGALCL